MYKSFLLAVSFFILCYGCKKTEKCDNEPPDTLKTGLIAYYPFNGNTNDESGNNNNGTAIKDDFTNDKNGTANRAFNFDGNNYIKVPNSASLSSIKDAISITAWVYNADIIVPIVCKAAYNGQTMQFRLCSHWDLMFANNGQAADFPVSLELNTWKHIAVVSDGSSTKYYLNGVLRSTVATHFDETAQDYSSEMYIGADTHGITEYYTGKLDEIRIYNRLLSEEEVLKIYNN